MRGFLSGSLFYFMSKNVIKTIQYIFFLTVGVGLLYYVLNDPNIDLKQVWKKILDAKWEWVMLSLLASWLSHIVRALRWKQLLQSCGESPKLINVYNAMMSGYFTNTAIPRVGEFVRCGLLKKSDNVPFTTAFGTAMTERLIDIFMLLSLVGLGLFLQYDIISDFFDEKVFIPVSTFVKEKSTPKNLILLALGIVAVLYLFVKSTQKIEKAMEEKKENSLDDMVDDIWKGLGSILRLKSVPLFIFYTIAIWVGYYLINYLCFFAFAPTSSLGWLAGLTVLGMGSLSKSLPTPGHGAGAYHAFVSYLLVSYGIAQEDGLVLAIVIHGTQTLFYIIFGAISYSWISLFSANNIVVPTLEDA